MTSPRKERWPRREPGNRLDPECWPVLNPRFQIEPGASVFTIGSCFARSIERHLSQMGFDIPTLNFLKENPDPQQIFDENVLNKYTPPSIYQELAWTRQIMDRDDCVRMEDIERFLYPLDDGRVLDLQRRSNFPALAAEEALRQRQIYYRLVRHAFDCDVAVITLGLIECWRDTERDIYVEYSPALHGKPHPFVFETLDYPSALSFVQRSIDLINRDSPKKILITTSPVPLARTFGDEDVIVANSYSKSVLRVVAGAIAKNNAGVDYFPSYESVMLSKRSDIWEDDLIHIESSFVGRIMSRVTESYVRSGTAALAKDAAFNFIGHVNSRRWPQAAAAWSECEASPPLATAEFDVCAAEFHARQGRRDEALASAAAALDSIHIGRPSVWDLHLRCAVVAESLADADLSKAHHGRAIATIGRNPLQWRRWIGNQTNLRKGERLAWVLANAEERNPDHVDVLLLVGQCHEKAGAHADAERLYRKVLQIDPQHNAALLGYAVLLLKDGQVDKARELTLQLDLCQTIEGPQVLRLAAQLVQAKQPALAEPLLRRFIEAFPDNVRAQFWLARCVADRAGAAEALPIAAKAARLDPGFKPAENLLARLQRETRGSAAGAAAG